MKYSITVSLILLTIFVSLQLSHAEDGIYGEDDRTDVSSIVDFRVNELARSTAAMIPISSLSRSSLDESRTKIATRVYGVANGLCSNERFFDYPKAALCSGFLVGKNLLVTAGHCVQTEADCASRAWVFDYNLATLQETAEHSVPNQSVFQCKKIVKQVLDPWFSDEKMDYAVIELDRSVPGRAPLPIRREGAVQVGDPLLVIGHPAGLPTISDTGVVRNTDGFEFFTTNLDTYGGNSGSSVFNAKTGVVEGILVRGDTDFVISPQGNCMQSVRCSDTGCDGEQVTRMTMLQDVIPKLVRGKRSRSRARR